MASRRIRKANRYDHLQILTGFDLLDETSVGMPDFGYPAFILGRDVETQEVKTRLNLRPTPWLRILFAYQVQNTDYQTETDSNMQFFELPDGTGFRFPTDTPGRRLLAGEHNAHTYSANIVLTPWERLALNGTFSYYNSRTQTEDNDDPAVEDFVGDIYSVIVGGTFAMDKRTDINAHYSFSQGDYSQDGFLRTVVSEDGLTREKEVTGLPQGIEYQQHNLRGLSPDWRKPDG